MRARRELRPRRACSVASEIAPPPERIAVGSFAKALQGLAPSSYAMSLSDVSRGYVTVDGVMGGRSTGGAAWQNGGIRFEGNVNTYGGGFAYLVLQFSVALDLSGQSGLLFEYDTLPYSTYGSAPIAVQVSLESSKRCSLTGAFAIPTTASTQRTKEWVPFSRFEPKGSHWSYSSSRTGVPSSCSGQTTEVSRVTEIHLGIYYQDGPYSLFLHNFGQQYEALPETLPGGAAGVLTAALARARSLIGNSGAGGGAAQMHGLANVALETAARQSARAGLLAAIDGAFDNPATARSAYLIAAVEAEIASPTAMVGTRPRRRRRRRRAAAAAAEPAAAVVPSSGARQHAGVPAAAALAAAAAAAAAVAEPAAAERAAAAAVAAAARLPAALSSQRRRREERPPDRRRREHHPRRRRRDRRLLRRDPHRGRRLLRPEALPRDAAGAGQPAARADGEGRLDGRPAPHRRHPVHPDRQCLRRVTV